MKETDRACSTKGTTGGKEDETTGEKALRGSCRTIRKRRKADREHSIARKREGKERDELRRGGGRRGRSCARRVDSLYMRAILERDARGALLHF